MTLTELLAQINAGIQDLNRRSALGEDVSAELTQAQQDADAIARAAQAAAPAGELPSAAAPPVSTLSADQELEQLRENERRRILESVGQRAASAEMDRWRNQQEQDAAVIAAVTRTELAKALGPNSGPSQGGDSIEEIVRRTMSEQRSPSRYVGQDANEAGTELALRALPGAQGVVEQPHVKAQQEGIKRIREGKNLAQFMGMITKQRMGKQLSDAEQGFLWECQSKAMAESTDSAGGYLVHPEWMPDILGLLRSSAVVRAANVRTIQFAKSMAQTSISSGATAYYHLENANMLPSELTFAEAPLLTPKNLTGLVPVSNFLLGDAPDADDIVRGDLAEVIALREDLSFIQGTGSGGEPRGMKNMTGRTLDPLALGANGSYLSLPQTRQIRNTYRSFNTRNPRWHYFFPPQFLSHLEGLTDADGRFLVDTALLQIDDGGATGRFDGVPFSTTTQIPVNITTGSSTNTTYLLLVDLNELIIGDNKTLELAVSTEASYTPDGGTSWISAFQAQQTLFRAGIRHDIAHRRPNHVIVQTGVRV